ncbi:MAG: hypothetical protein PVH41_15290 [Anaerolineae bacterium]
MEPKEEIIVGVLGQWGSGKSTAARTLVRYLGGEDGVTFLTDRELFASRAVNHVLDLEGLQVKSTIEDDGRQRLVCDKVAVWLRPGEDLKTVDLNTLRFDVHDSVQHLWLNDARVELGHQIVERSADRRPIVIEAGFGRRPSGHTISDLFTTLEAEGVEARRVKWIVVEACYKRRSERNEKRRDSVPAEVFARYAADGGDLDPDHQSRLEKRGATIRRVLNDHDDIERFRVDVIAAFDGMFGGVLRAGAVDGSREQG